MYKRQPGRCVTRMIRLPTTYRRAMIGTIFSVKLAIRLIPPMKMIAATIATKIPTAIVGTWNALLNATPIELDCTMLPMNPSARTVSYTHLDVYKRQVQTIPRSDYRMGNSEISPCDLSCPCLLYTSWLRQTRRSIIWRKTSNVSACVYYYSNSR